MTKLSTAQTEALTKMIERQNKSLRIVDADYNRGTLKALQIRGMITWGNDCYWHVTPAGYEAVGMSAPVTEPAQPEATDAPVLTDAQVETVELDKIEDDILATINHYGNPTSRNMIMGLNYNSVEIGLSLISMIGNGLIIETRTLANARAYSITDAGRNYLRQTDAGQDDKFQRINEVIGGLDYVARDLHPDDSKELRELMDFAQRAIELLKVLKSQDIPEVNGFLRAFAKPQA